MLILKKKILGLNGTANYSIRTFDVMIDKGLHRFEKKMNNIEKHFKNIVREANQKKYRLKPIKNGSLRIL